MKPQQWQLDLYQDLFSFAPYNSDLARAFVAVDMDQVPEADEKGRRRVGGYKVTFEGVVRKGKIERESERSERVCEYASAVGEMGQVGLESREEETGLISSWFDSDEADSGRMDQLRRSVTWRSSSLPSGRVRPPTSHISGHDPSMERIAIVNWVRCTSGAIIAIMTDTFWAPPMLSGVSIDLNVQYFHPVPV